MLTTLIQVLSVSALSNTALWAKDSKITAASSNIANAKTQIFGRHLMVQT
jgi:flagellar basal body rod protein FlgC